MSDGKSKNTGGATAAADGEEKNKKASDGKTAGAASAEEWTKAVLNQFGEAQKTWFELASRQNALFLETISKTLGYRQDAPTDALSEWVKQGVEAFIESQKRWSEIAVQQSEQILKAVQSNANFSGLNQESNQKSANEGVEALIKMRSAWLDFAAEQNSQAISLMKKSLNLDESSPMAALANFAEEAVNNYIEVQKQWLDLASHFPFGGATVDKSKK